MNARLENRILQVLDDHHPHRVGEILGQLLNDDSLVTGGDVTRALENLELLNRVANVYGNCWRLTNHASR